MRSRAVVSRDADIDPAIDATLELVVATARAYQAIVDSSRQDLAEAGLGLTEFAVLEVLHHKGPLPLGEIRDRILVTGASTTYVVKKLEQRGLVRRRPAAEDRRVVIGELTPAGTDLIRAVFPVHLERLLQVTSSLSEAERRTAASLLRRLGEASGSHTP